MSKVLLRVGVCSGALVSLVAAPASAQERWSVDVAASGGVATNPYQDPGSTPVTGSASIQLSPSYITESALTTWQLSGDIARTEYFQKQYRADQSYALNGSGTHNLSERSQISARLGYVNAIVGGYNGLGVIGGRTIIPGITPGQPVLPPTLEPVFPVSPTTGLLPGVITDPSLGGIGQRRQSYQAGAGFNTRLGPRDSFYTNLSVVASRAKGGFDDYNYVSQGFGYSRTINERLSVSGDVQVSNSDYLGRRLGDTISYQPSLGINYQLNDKTRVSVNAGVSVNRIAENIGTTTSTSFNGSASLCKQDVRWDACFSLSRSTVPSSFQGVRTQNAASLSFGYRIGPLDSLSLSGSYSRTGAPIGNVVLGPALTRTEFISARAEYGRTISPRLTAFVNGGVVRTKDDFASRDANLEARAGLRYRFGADR